MKNIIYPILKSLLLNLGILRTILKLRIRFTKGVTVLMIHHGYEKECLTLPKMSISYSNFNLLYVFLKKYFTIISPKMYKEHLENDKKLPHNSLLITIDDSYQNIEPLLATIVAHNDLAIIFPVTSHIGTDKLFWWDVAYQSLKAQGVIDLESEMYKLKKMEQNERDQFLEGLEKNGPTPLYKAGAYSLNWKQLSEWQLKGFTIGNHTDSHTFMHECSQDEIIKEIESAMNKIKNNLEVTPQWFAFPAGFDFEDSKELLKKYNFTGAFSTVFGIASNDRYFLKRINISDDIISAKNSIFNLAETTWGFILAR